MPRVRWATVLALTVVLSLYSEERQTAQSLECHPKAQSIKRYRVLMTGNPAGWLIICRVEPDVRELLFEYTDRGRGPQTQTRYRFAGDLPVEIDTHGVDYYKNAISERFVLEGDVAKWKNRVEEGQRPRAARHFFLGFSSPRAELALLARALLNARDKRLSVIPEGDAWIEHSKDYKISNGRETRIVTHHTIKGLGFFREHVWLDAQREYFGSASAWLSVVPDGWESVVAQLRAAQDRFDAERSAEIARNLPRRPSGPVAFTNARVFDAQRAAIMPRTTVIIDGDRIASVGTDGTVAMPRGAEIRNLGGATLLPGLWDMHVHLNELGGLLNIATGVTSVRDLGNDPDTLADLQKRFNDGTAVGPRVVMAGLIDGPGQYQGPTKYLVTTPAEARAAVNAYVARGYRHIKLYSSLDPALVPVIVAQAQPRKLRVSGHVPAFMTAEQAVRAGYDEIQHMNMLFLNFWPDIQDTRTPARFTAVAERAADLDLTSAPVGRFIDLLKHRRVVVDPTLSIFEGMFTDRPGRIAAAYAPVVDRFPPFIRRSFLDGGLPRPAESDAQYRRSFDAMLKMLKRLYDVGVPIVAGTDALAGFTLHRELELYVAAGIPAPAVLQLATLGAARVAGLADTTGSIVPGKWADLLVVDGDPTRVISDIRRTRLVVKGGVLFDREAIDRALSTPTQIRH